MNGKERVLAAINHDKPDRIPVDFGTTNCTSMALKAHRNLAQLLGIDAGTNETLMMKSFQLAAVDERILERFQIDTRGIYGNELHKNDVILDASTYINEWGITFKMPKNGLYYDIIDRPLKDALLEDLDKHKWPDAYDKERVTGLRERARKLYEEGKYALVGDIVDSGIFEPCWYLRGFENFLMDLVGDEEFATALMSKMLEIQLGRYEVFLDAVGKYLDVVFFGDDLATANSTLMSSDTYRKMVKPFHKKYISGLKSMTNAKIMHHSCGNTLSFIDDFIEIGVDIMNPIQVSAIDVDQLKEKYGGKIVFWGGIDTTQVLPNGTPEDVKHEVEKRIAQLGPSGYVLAAVHDIQADVSAENIVTMFDTAVNYNL